MKKKTITSTSPGGHSGLKPELESMMPTMEQPDIIKAARIIGKAINAAFDSLAMAVFFGLVIGLIFNGCMR